MIAAFSDVLVVCGGVKVLDDVDVLVGKHILTDSHGDELKNEVDEAVKS